MYFRFASSGSKIIIAKILALHTIVAVLHLLEKTSFTSDLFIRAFSQ